MPSEVINGSHQTSTVIHNKDECLCHMRRNTDYVNHMQESKELDGEPNLKDEAFKKEVKKLIDEHLSTGTYPKSLLAVQNTDLLLPNNKSGQSYGGLGRGVPSVIPICDINDTECVKHTTHEIQLRCKVAALYRLIDLNGWSHGIFNHISARINDIDEHFVIHPFGLLYSEVTASSLVTIDLDGEVLEHGSTSLGINQAGFILHSAIHQARPDIKCIIHLHTGDAVAVSAMKCGLLPMSQEALIVGEVGYHDYNGILVDEEERKAIQHNLGPHKKVMFLKNHGIVACGSTVEEAYHHVVNVMLACQSQIKALSAGLENVILVSEEVQRKTFAIGNKGGGGVNTGKQQWKLGEFEFEAVMRQLDNVGYKTGYMYKQNMSKEEARQVSINTETKTISRSCSDTDDGHECLTQIKTFSFDHHNVI